MKRKFQAVKGTRDILPPESSLWSRVEHTACQVFSAYNFHEIRPPIFEEYEVFARSVGLDTDIVSKEMYTLEDRDGTVLALRPEATASVCRAYIEHGMHTWPSPVKLYYIGPMFRRERPQKGRFRQFYQIGAEVLGPSDNPAIDAEVIELVMVFLERCGLKGATLYVNSIGCGECRPKYVELLRKELQKVKDKLGPDSQRRIDTNPLRVLDSKLEEEQGIIAKLPSILDHLCEACRDHFAKVQQELKDRGLQYEINWRLVRGLDYYMRTTFEITAPGLGSQNAVCGGGRYDGLVELLGGQPTKGIGWALGTDRLVLALQQTEAGKAAPPLDAYIVWLGDAAYARARELARKLRDAGASVEIPHEGMKLKKALGRADQLHARYAVILGEDELKAGAFTLRDMATGAQRSLSESDLLKELKPQMNADERR
ncbi:MAG TPA: histidine--tRNA ligase [Candidatus Acidoferrales bacterium]|nr:histidine--tRNA ligase [Candidatus Acidoferrales bacterium]